jgi:hypothetical protein
MENTIKVGLKGIEYEDMVLIELAGKVQLHFHVNMIMNTNKVSKMCTNKRLAQMSFILKQTCFILKGSSSVLSHTTLVQQIQSITLLL